MGRIVGNRIALTYTQSLISLFCCQALFSIYLNKFLVLSTGTSPKRAFHFPFPPRVQDGISGEQLNGWNLRFLVE